MKTQEYNQLITKYGRYIETLAFRWAGNDEEKEDLYQEGCIALLNLKYDENKGDIDTYAKMMIRFALKNYLTNNGRLIRIPAHNQHSTKYEEKRVTNSIYSISSNIHDDLKVEDIISSEIEDNEMDDEQYNKNLAIKGVINQLSPRYQYIVSHYFGFVENNEVKTIQEIADELQITKQAVSQQLQNALSKIEKQLKK